MLNLNLNLIKKAYEESKGGINEKFTKIVNAININSVNDLNELYSLLLIEDEIEEVELDNYFGKDVLTFVVNGIYVTLRIGQRAYFQVL